MSVQVIAVHDMNVSTVYTPQTRKSVSQCSKAPQPQVELASLFESIGVNLQMIVPISQFHLSDFPESTHNARL